MLKEVLVPNNFLYPGGVDPVNNINYNENDNDLRLLYSRVLNLILTVDNDVISDFVPLIAWCLFVINGLLDDDNKSMEKLQSSGDAEKLPWHSVDAYERKIWIPDAIQYRPKSKYLILKLKSFLNHHYHYTLHHPNYRAERSPYFGISLFPKHPNSTVMQFFNSELFPILSCRISSTVFDLLKHYGYHGLYLCCGQTYAMTGPVTFCIENHSYNPIFELKGVEDDNKLISYKVQREIKHYNEYKFNGFFGHPICSKIEYYSLGKTGPTTQVYRLLSLPEIVIEDVEIVDCLNEETERHPYSGICYNVMPGISFIDKTATTFNLEDRILFYFHNPSSALADQDKGNQDEGNQDGKRRRINENNN